MFPNHVDCVVIGTGLTNSIIAAACARVGKSVIHLDSQSYYGENWASFSFEQLIDWLKTNHPNNESLQEIPQVLIDKSKHFCIDLCPKLLFSNGKMTDLLTHSNVARYHEFSNKVRILALNEDSQIYSLPYKRSDVFKSSIISSLLDKRRLTKFIETCLSYEDNDTVSDELKPFLDSPIQEYLSTRQLSSTLRMLIINFVAMVEPNESTRIACKNIKKFMLATERYGNSPFFFPLYGCGEFPQSFCRLCAVFGGIYCLNKGLDKVESASGTEEEPGKFSVTFDSNQRKVLCDKVVLCNSDATRLKFTSKTPSQYINRAILITDFSILEHEDQSFSVSFLRIPSNTHKNSRVVYLLEVNSNVAVAPSGLHIAYFWTLSNSMDCGPLIDIIKESYGGKYSDIIWKCTYSVATEGQVASSVDNLFITSLPDETIEYDGILEDARRVFESIYPDTEFLPRAPDSDEIIT